MEGERAVRFKGKHAVGEKRVAVGMKPEKRSIPLQKGQASGERVADARFTRGAFLPGGDFV